MKDVLLYKIWTKREEISFDMIFRKIIYVMMCYDITGDVILQLSLRKIGEPNYKLVMHNDYDYLFKFILVG